MFAPEDLTDDGFLGGRLRILQPRVGYRAATDPVLLAASVPAKAGESVLELGCGAGVAILCLAERVQGLRLTGVELQPAYADLARRNAAANGKALQVVESDLQSLPPELRISFDHVIANPPYYPDGGGTSAADRGRETALREATPMAVWVDVALKRLRPGGRVTLIQSADRLPDLLAGLAGRAGGVTVLPILPRDARPARRVIVTARKGGAAPFRLLAPLVMHAGAEHERDADSFNPVARAILRDGQALPMG